MSEFRPDLLIKFVPPGGPRTVRRRSEICRGSKQLSDRLGELLRELESVRELLLGKE